ncbi:MAG: pilus assembly protein PilM [Candidatus Paceibacterota bacterium]
MRQLYNRYFPTPSYLAMNSFAIDISDQSIKYGELLATPHGLRLGRFGKERIGEGVVVSGKIEDQDKLALVLKKIKEKENLHFVRVSLPEEQMYLFTLSLPKVDEKNLRNIILLQIEEHIPLKAIDTVFEYDIISSGDKNILVLVSAIALTTVEGYLSAFKKAGLSPLSFELEAQAISRAVVPSDDMGPVMIVDFGETRTGVSIVHENKVFFTTTLDMGGVSLTNMIAKNFSLPFEKAEEMKHSYGLGGISNIEDIFPVILNGISVLRDELNKQYLYWKNHDNLGIKHDEIGRIILCGGDANLTGLADYLEASMKIRVDHANAWINISDMKISIPSMSFEESLGYATVLGLALGGFTYSPRAIVNVLPDGEKTILKIEYWKRFTSTFLIFCSLIITIFIFLLLPAYFLSASKEVIEEEKLNVFNSNNKDLPNIDLNSTIVNINNKLKILSAVKPSYSFYNDILGIVFLNKIEGITFSQFLFSQRKDKSFMLEVHGESRDRETLRNFKTMVEKNPRVASTILPISNFLEKNNLNFTLSIIMKPYEKK